LVPLRVLYQAPEKGSLPQEGLLATVRFSSSAASSPESACGSEQPSLLIDVGLRMLGDAPQRAEHWYGEGIVRRGECGKIRYSHDDHFLVGLIELDEHEHGGLSAASEAAYEAIGRFQETSAFPDLVRIWNYFDAINDGPGDLERYRQFCGGRTRALARWGAHAYPAATAIGHQHTLNRLQVYWIASNRPGKAIENPRQVSAYRYPRMHSPAAPTFARATVTGDGTVLVSGTASIVGHVSRHVGAPLEQLAEIQRNLAALSTRVRQSGGGTGSERGVLKVYVREPALIEGIASWITEHVPAADVIFLAGDICRKELLVEIEALWAPQWAAVPSSKVGSR